jgi:hypothetical protein
MFLYLDIHNQSKFLSSFFYGADKQKFLEFKLLRLNNWMFPLTIYFFLDEIDRVLHSDTF